MRCTRAGLYLSQAAEMTVWFYANQILQGLSQIHTSFFFVSLPGDLASAALFFHPVLKGLCLAGPRHLFHLGSSSRRAAGTAGVQIFHKTRVSPQGLFFTSFCSAQIKETAGISCFYNPYENHLSSLETGVCQTSSRPGTR